MLLQCYSIEQHYYGKIMFCFADNGDFEAVWHQHCQDQSVLSVYAQSMKTLAQRHWTKNSKTRIDWCQETINEYFHGGGLRKVLEKEEKRQNREIRMKQDDAGRVGTAADDVQSSDLYQHKIVGRSTAGRDSCNVAGANSLIVSQNNSGRASIACASTKNADAKIQTMDGLRLFSTSDTPNTTSPDPARDHQGKQDIAMAANEQTERTPGSKEREKLIATPDHVFTQV